MVFIAKYPETPDTMTPMSTGMSRLVSKLDSRAFGASTTTDPKMEGMDIKKANLTAKFLSRPENNPPTKVDPDLDIPGAIATDWHNPMMTA